MLKDELVVDVLGIETEHIRPELAGSVTTPNVVALGEST